MPRRNPNGFEPRGSHQELTWLLRRIKSLTIELHELREQGRRDPELEAKERTLDRLRWRLATVAKRSATNDLGNAA